MSLLMPRKKSPASRPASNSTEAQIARLAKQNATLKREIARLQV